MTENTLNQNSNIENCTHENLTHLHTNSPKNASRKASDNEFVNPVQHSPTPLFFFDKKVSPIFFLKCFNFFQNCSGICRIILVSNWNLSQQVNMRMFFKNRTFKCHHYEIQSVICISKCYLLFVFCRSHSSPYLAMRCSLLSALINRAHSLISKLVWFYVVLLYNCVLYKKAVNCILK